MTTIAYRDGVMAGDAQVTDNGQRVGSARKVWEKNGVLYGAAGKMSEVQRFHGWVSRGLKGDPPGMDKSTGIIVHGARIVSFSEGQVDQMTASHWAIGSGCEIAMGAMDAGLSAEAAVRVAAKRDVHTGGEITVVRR